MESVSWFDLLPAAARRGLLAASGIVLGSATVLSGAAPPEGRTALAIGATVALGATWIASWAILGRPVVVRRAAERRAEAELRERDRGLLVARAVAPVAAGPYAGLDVAFSLPVLSDLVRTLHRSACGDAGPGDPEGWLHGPSRVLGVQLGRDRTVLAVLVQVRALSGGSAARVLRLSRLPSASSPSPAEVAAGALGWQLEGADPIEPPPELPLAPDPGLPAARRALLARDGAFDLDAFEALVAEIDAVVDATAAERTARSLEPYATPGGLENVRWWLAGPGLPPSDGRSVWIEVDRDGWADRIEVCRGERVLGLLRWSGRPDAPWLLWRLRSAP